MNIFIKWGFGKNKKTIEELKKELKLVKKANYGLMEEIKLKKIELKDREEAIDTLKHKNRVLMGDKGSIKRKYNALLEENETLNKQIEDFKSTHWLVKKTPSGRKPKAQTIRSKNCSVTSKIAKGLKDE